MVMMKSEDTEQTRSLFSKGSFVKAKFKEMEDYEAQDYICEKIIATPICSGADEHTFDIREKKDSQYSHLDDWEMELTCLPSDENIGRDANIIEQISPPTHGTIEESDTLLQKNDKDSRQTLEQEKRSDFRINKLTRALAKERRVRSALSQKLQEMEVELEKCQEEIVKQKYSAGQCQEKLTISLMENKRLREQLDTTRFHHLPLGSPKFLEIGPVNHNLVETKRQIGDYQIGRFLGKGYLGTVVRGTLINRDGSDNNRFPESTEYAVKIIPKNRVKSTSMLEQLCKEIGFIQRFRHNNILSLHEILHATNNIYIVTELCSMDLHQFRCEYGGITASSLKQVMFGILRALAVLHANGVCHLDVKPENVLLANIPHCLNNAPPELWHAHVKLCDFGLAYEDEQFLADGNHSSDIIRKGSACGTAGFFAPEMVVNGECEGRAADMWSFGCTLLDMSVGHSGSWMSSYALCSTDIMRFKQGIEDFLHKMFGGSYSNHNGIGYIVDPCLNDLLRRLLIVDAPKNRLSADQALDHPWITNKKLEEKRKDGALAMPKTARVSWSLDDLRDQASRFCCL